MAQRKSMLIPLLCFGSAFLTLLFFSRSSFLYLFNPWVDTNASFTMGKALFHGRVLYADIYDQRGPYLYLLYGLASLLSSTTFTGVFLFELASFTMFLWISYRIAKLYVPQTAWVVIPLLAALIPASLAFVLGGSPEELLLPVFAYVLLCALRLRKGTTTSNPGNGSLLLNGFLCGIVLWTKYSLLGFHLGYLILLCVLTLRQKQPQRLIKFGAIFLSGLCLATLPWLIYFGVHHAIHDWLDGYILRNITNYAFRISSAANPFVLFMANLFQTFSLNIRYSLFVLIGLIWLLLSRKPALLALEKYGVWLIFACSTLGIYYGGIGFVYYGLPISVFAVFGVIALLTSFERYRQISVRAQSVVRVGWIGVCVLFFLSGFFTSMNPPYLRASRDDYALFRFRDTINRSDSPTLMNYGALDMGLYTLCDITPQTKYFCELNLKSKEMKSEIDGYLQSGTTEFVVSNLANLDKRFTRYELIDHAYTICNEGKDDIYLYQRIETPSGNGN